MRRRLIKGGAYPSGTGGGGGGGGTGGGTVGAPLGIGINIDRWWAFGGDQPFRDLVKAAWGFTQVGLSDDSRVFVAMDVNGWPDADFRIRPQATAPFSTPNGTIYGSFKGKTTNGAADFVVVYAAGFTLNTGSWAYDVGTNTTTFTISYVADNVSDQQPWSFELINTHKDNVAAEGTGIADLILSRPPYTLANVGAALFTDEYKAYWSRYTHLRSIHSFGGWTNDYTTDWNTRPTIENTRAGATYCNPASPGYANGYPMEYLITLTNECNNAMWVTIPMNATDNYGTGLATLIQGTSNPGKTHFYEMGNEAWFNSPGSTCYNTVMREAMKTSLSIIGTYENFPVKGAISQTASRASNGNLTLTLPLGHWYVTGDKIYPVAFDGIDYGAETNVTVNSTTSITIPTSIQSAGTVTITPNWRASGPLNNALRHSSSLAVDPLTDFYSMRFRWVGKRSAELSAAMRAVYGDVEFNANHRFVISDKMVDGGYATGVIEYVSKKFTGNPVSYYLYGFAGAPYIRPLPIRNTTGVSIDELVAAWQTNLAADEIVNYRFESRSLHARWFGVKHVVYEYGLDSQYNSGTSTDRNNRTRAGFDSRIRDYIRDNVLKFWQYGGAEISWYAGYNEALTSDGPISCFALRTGYSDETTAKISATNELITANYPVQGRHAIPGTIPIIAYVDNFAPTYSGNTAPMRMQASYGADWPEGMLEYATWCETPGTYTWTLGVGCWQAILGRTWQMWHNGVQCGADILGPVTNSNGNLGPTDADRYANPTNITRTITATAGWNDFRIKMTNRGDSPVEYGFWSMSVT